MNFIKFLSKDNINAGVNQNTKDNILKQISQLAKKSEVLNNIDEQDIFKALKNREKLGSTGFAKGLAIPHCKIPGISKFVVGVVTAPHGVEFNSLDGKPTKLLIFIIAPESERNQHIHLLSSISRAFNSASKINELVSFDSPEKIYDFLTKAKDSQTDDENDLIDYCTLQVFIQTDDYFMDILEIFSELNNCSVSVTNANDLGYYINALPLYSSFWNETEKQSHQVVSAIIKKTLSNEIIRRIQNVTGELNKNSGVMITLQDLVYKNGSLNI